MNATEEYRHACETRYVAAMPDEKRREFYEGVLKHRGKEKANQLIDDVNQLRRKERANVALQEG
ncbi:MAG: hypothetical protein ABS69_10660 [Nitrosomonadales bacterium SCN 54-20]|nr:MAG: hypothetical protein ABS69_10660 [Nitrosomonadales bacterium SCN 54-20]